MSAALLIDLDGTLVDTHAANLLSYRLALDETGLTYDARALAGAVGRLPWRAMLAQVLPDATDRHTGIAVRKREIYADQMHLVRVNDRLVQMVATMRAVGWKTALVTAASRGSVTALMRSKGFDGLFDVVVTSDDTILQKPHPEPYYIAASQLGVTPPDCVICEDSDVGLAAAAAFGCQIWQVRWCEND